MTLTLADANRVIAGAVERANQIGVKMNIAVCDAGGRLRSSFTAGALAGIRYAKIHGTGRRPWLTALRGLFVCCAVRVCSWHIADGPACPL